MMLSKKLMSLALLMGTALFFYLFIVNPYRISGDCMERR